ncbi:Genome sequencing data, contig C298 [Microcystis aeruginosa PCC 9807]|uniref:Genome sequencing data, contig C298 n=1 Tax=Microcystis aeruginosa PCC 9807 TaxID=1160283 RepID=I4H241_MICAE|nr:glycerophosphoryl diester phosphodiesterase membrane domain-containing protein [Microcystis aeruginosa]CCI16115.1 Genome sequencing data, contig C298 [Microcystis aeruginosa PCC 9807]
MTNNSIEPLNIGNTINTAFRLYRDRFQTYVFFAVRACLWSLLPLILQLILSQLLYQTITPEQGSDIGLRLFLFPIQIFSAAKSLFNNAVISRLAFQDIIYQPETAGQAEKKVKPKMWRLWWMQVLIFLLGAAIILPITLSLGLVSGVIPILGVLLILLASFCLPVFFLWLSARICIAELPLVIEDNLGSWQAIKRGWHLTKNSAWRIVGVMFIASLLIIPVYILSVALASIPLWANFSSFYSSFESVEDWQTLAENPLFFQQMAMFLTTIFLLLSTLLVPFWQSLKSVIYNHLLDQKKNDGGEY